MGVAETKPQLTQFEEAIETEQAPSLGMNLNDPGLIPGRGSELSERCELCYGTGMEVVSGKGARHCACQHEAERKRALAVIKPEFGIPRFANIVADPKRHPQQAVKIAAIRQALLRDSSSSFLIFGDNGT